MSTLHVDLKTKSAKTASIVNNFIGVRQNSFIISQRGKNKTILHVCANADLAIS